MAELVLVAHFAERASASAEAQTVARRIGISLLLKRHGDGWGLFAHEEHAARVRTRRSSPPEKPALANAPGASPAQKLESSGTTMQRQSPLKVNRIGEPAPVAVSFGRQQAGDMANELRIAYSRLSQVEANAWLKRTLGRFPRMVSRRIGNLAGTAASIVEVTGSEVTGLVRAVLAGRPLAHLSERLGTGADRIVKLSEQTRAVALPLLAALRDDPGKVAPDLFVAGLAFYISGGGFDADGGIPDTDIPTLGIGAHRSIFTHSIIAGAVVETALHSLVDFIGVAYAHLPEGHDDRWTRIYERLKRAAASGNKGMSAGLAYHLGVDGLVQPAAYHGLPIEMPLSMHQTIQAANAAAEGMDVLHKESVDGPQAHAHPSASGKPDERKLWNLVAGAGIFALMAWEEIFG